MVICSTIRPKYFNEKMEMFCVFSQKYYVPMKNFAGIRKTSAFSRKKTAFPQGTLRVLVKHLLSPVQCFASGKQYFNEQMQMFCKWRNIFESECNNSARERKCFASKCKDFWGNSKFLRVIKKFLVLERNTFAFSHKSITCPRETLQTLAKLLRFFTKVLHSPKEVCVCL